MKKSFSIYSIVWVICLAVFNLIVFVSPVEMEGSFWIGYVGITVAFLIQLACALVAFQAKNIKKFFYKLSLISVSYSGLVTTLIAGSVFMAIPALPEWIGVIVCVIILAFNAIAIIKATVAANVVSGIDQRIKTQTRFMNNLSADAQSLMNATDSYELCREAKKVYETIRYSDPMASDALFELDLQIQRQFAAFADAVKSEDVELAKETSGALIELVETRNQKCKLIK